MDKKKTLKCTDISDEVEEIKLLVYIRFYYNAWNQRSSLYSKTVWKTRHKSLLDKRNKSIENKTLLYAFDSTTNEE